MEADAIARRLREARESTGLSQADWSKKVSVALGTIKKIERAVNVPSGETLLAYARAGFDPGWILTGAGSMIAGAAELPAGDLDAELLGRVVDAVGKLYRELGMSIPGIELGRLSAEKYAEIVAASDDAAEYPTMLKLTISQLRKELLSTRESEHRKGRA